MGARDKLNLVQPLLMDQVGALNAYYASMILLTTALKKSKKALEDQIKVSDSSERLRQDAEYWSITGGMLPWVITGVSSAFIVGYVAGSVSD